MIAPFYNDPLAPIAGEGTAPYSVLAHVMASGQGWSSAISTAGVTQPVISTNGGLRAGAASTNAAVYGNDNRAIANGIVSFDLFTGTDTGSYAGVILRESDNGTTDSGFAIVRQAAIMLCCELPNVATNALAFKFGSGSIGFANNTTYAITIFYSGPYYAVFRNGTLITSGTNSTYSTGRVAIYHASGATAPSDAGSMRVSNLKVYEQPAVNVAIDNPALFWSPLIWYKNGSASRQTVNTGSYCKFMSTSGFIGVGVDTSALGGAQPTTIGIGYQINDGAWQNVVLTAGQTMFYIATDATPSQARKIRIEPYSIGGNLRWSTPLIITGIAVEPGSVTSAPTIRSKRMAVFGDSTTECYGVLGGTATDARYSWVKALAIVRDCEYAQIGFSSQGFRRNGNGGVPFFPAAWSLYFQGQSRLGEAPPDECWVMQGQNDYLNGTAPATVTSDASSTWANMRAAWPTTEFFICVNPSGAMKDALLASVLPDARFHFVTAAADKLSTLFSTVVAPTPITIDGTHLTPQGYGWVSTIFALEAARIAQAALLATDLRLNVAVKAVDGLSTITGSLTVPNRNQVASGVAVDGTTGTATWPTEAQVAKGVTWTQGGLTKTGTLEAGSTGYPLLDPNIVLFGFDLGDGSKGKYVEPIDTNVIENAPFGVNKTGKYRPADPTYYASDGPGFGNVAALTPGSALFPATTSMIVGSTFRKGGVVYNGRYVQPAQSSYLSIGPGYGVDGNTHGTATGGGGQTQVVFGSVDSVRDADTGARVNRGNRDIDTGARRTPG